MWKRTYLSRYFLDELETFIRSSSYERLTTEE